MLINMAGDICIRFKLIRKNENRQMTNTIQTCPCKQAVRDV